jgi:hypothetical protein
VILEAASPDGGWVSFCQARDDSNRDGTISAKLGPRGEITGDALQSYLAFGPGTGEPVDALLAQGKTGRWLVVQQSGRALLIDARTKKRADLSALGADSRSDALEYRPHRSFSFDASETRLAYIRRGADQTRLVILELESGSETVIDPGPGELWRAEFAPGDAWVALRMIVDDSNHNGRLDWPFPAVDVPRWRCHGQAPVPSLSVWADRGDRVVTKLAPASGGAVRTETGLVVPLAPGLLVRESSGRLLLKSVRGESEIASEKCGARVLHADPGRGLVLLACAQGRPWAHAQLEARGVAARKALALSVLPAGPDRWQADSPRLAVVYPGNGAALVDMSTLAVTSLETGDGVISQFGTRVLLRRGVHLAILETSTNHLTVLPGELDPLPDIVRVDGAAVVSPLVVDLSRGALLGTIVGRPLSVTTDGRVLVSQGGDASAQSLAIGPLVWRTPTPL